jgi:hypothetical protein
MGHALSLPYGVACGATPTCCSTRDRRWLIMRHLIGGGLMQVKERADVARPRTNPMA